jgi:hypothetical protein
MCEIILTIKSIREGETISGIDFDCASFLTAPELDAKDLERGVHKHFHGDLMNFSYDPDSGMGSFILLCSLISEGELRISYEASEHRFVEEAHTMPATAPFKEVHHE